MGICDSTNNQQQPTTNTINQNNLVNQTNQTNQTNQVNMTSQTNTTNNSTTGNNLDLSKIPERFLGNDKNNNQSSGILSNVLGSNTQNNTNNAQQSVLDIAINLGIQNKDVIINGAKQILGK